MKNAVFWDHSSRVDTIGQTVATKWTQSHPTPRNIKKSCKENVSTPLDYIDSDWWDEVIVLKQYSCSWHV
jgi:hypothetical protein